MAATARIEMRCEPQEKSLLERAAALQGTRTTAFIRQHAVAMAQQVIDDAERVEVAETGYRQILDLLDNPPEPNDTLRAAMRAHRVSDL